MHRVVFLPLLRPADRQNREFKDRDDEGLLYSVSVECMRDVNNNLDIFSRSIFPPGNEIHHFHQLSALRTKCKGFEDPSSFY